MRKEQSGREDSDEQMKKAARIASRVVLILYRIADKINWKLGKLRPKTLKIVFLLFTILLTVLSGYQVYYAMKMTRPNSFDKRTNSLSLPVREPSISKAQLETSDSVVEKIEKYLRQVDSSGESISPGLVDTLELMKSFYRGKNKEEK